MKKTPEKLKHSTENLILYIIFPLGELITCALICFEVTSVERLPFPLLIFTVLFSILLCIFVLYVYWERRKQTHLKTSYDQLVSLRELEVTHYQQINIRREELEKLKDGFSNELSSILTALKNEETEMVRSQITLLSEHLAATKEYPYCNNAIINAVLSEKETLCLKNNISFSINIQPCRFELITNLHLCSLFSNLLDNAIHSCELIPQPKKRHISLAVAEFGDYLSIKVTNSTPPQEIFTNYRRHPRQLYHCLSFQHLYRSRIWTKNNS